MKSMKILKRKKVENSSQVALKCGRTRSPVAEADNEVRLRFQARDCPLHETLRVDKKESCRRARSRLQKPTVRSVYTSRPELACKTIRVWWTREDDVISAVQRKGAASEAA